MSLNSVDSVYEGSHCAAGLVLNAHISSSLRCTERDDVQPWSETDSDQSQLMRSSERLQAEKTSVEARKREVEE